jgi:hypothetical protein
MLSRFKKINIKDYYIGLSVILFTSLCSQDFESKYNLEFNPNFSNQWWSHYNNYGQEPSKINFSYNAQYQKNKTNYYFLVLASKDRVDISESFIKSQLFDSTYLKAGKYYRDFSIYLNDELSSGSILISKNAKPMPKIGLLSSYKLKKNENIDFNFGISHGLFKKNEIYNKAPMLHEKFIYLNYKKNKNQLKVGIVHEAIWGGGTEIDGNFPSSFKDFLKIFISEDGPLLEGDSHANALGNHLGIWDFSYIRTIDNKILKIYYQHLFEDTSGLRFANRYDGLWGLELVNYVPKTNILLEYLDTTNQFINPPYVQESYYNHGEYPEGWSYAGYALGNPFINAGNYSDVNPLKMLHIGIGYNELSEYNYQLLFSRKIDTSDPIKYKIVFGKVVDSLLLNMFIIGEEGQKNNIGIDISYYL